MGNKRTCYIAAYDTEKAGDCLHACKAIRAAHAPYDMPGTFFIVGKRLEEEGAEYRAVLGDVPGFEIASHTYSHTILRDHPFRGNTPADGLFLRMIGISLNQWYSPADCDNIARGINKVPAAYCTPDDHARAWV